MEGPDFLRFIVSLVFVLSLMGGLWLLLKRLGINGHLPITSGQKKRVSLVEVLPIDIRHKAVILRCDDKDHLVILGPNGETVIQSPLPIQDVPDVT